MPRMAINWSLIGVKNVAMPMSFPGKGLTIWLMRTVFVIWNSPVVELRLMKKKDCSGVYV